MSAPTPNKNQETTLAVHRLGSINYEDATTLQNELYDKRLREEIPNTLLLLEHPNVITLGKRGSKADILVSQDVLEKHCVSVVQTPRGGQVTVHTPGQLIGYFIFHLYHKQRAAHAFVHTLEQVLIDTLATFSIRARHDEKHTGVWVENKKIASIGISISRGVTQHGFALNVNNDLRAFDWIVPCGMPSVHVSSMATLLERAPSMSEVCDAVAHALMTQTGYCDIIKYTSTPEW